MKTVLLLVALVFLAPQLFTQQTNDSIPTKENYLTISKKKATTAWILLGVGAGLTAGGIYAIHELANRQDDVKEISAPGVIATVGGAVMMVISVPYFNAAARNKRRATSIAMGHRSIEIPGIGNNAIHTQPTITLRIRL